METRVRFAPSPTGYLHIGGARTALFNWLFALQTGGSFVLRIEDTDTARSSSEMVDGILEGMTWLGLEWDEGPFFQSQRLDLYKSVCRQLETEGKAYRCFCKQLEAGKKDYDSAAQDPCRSLTSKDVRARMDEGEAAALRFKVPDGQVLSFSDEVFGVVRVKPQNLNDFIIQRSDGTPTYHLSVVADDVDMQITHVIRGADHLSNTSKHALLFEALGHPIPTFVHLPLILGPDKKRLSKRHGATSVVEYRRLGFLPEAVRNYLALLGWSPGTDQELFSDQELTAAFSLNRINKADAVFDLAKLEWMNGKLMTGLSAEQLEPGVRQVLEESELWQEEWGLEQRAWFLSTIELLKRVTRRLTDFSDNWKAFFSSDFPYDPEAVRKYLEPKDPGERARLLGSLDELTRTYESLNAFTLETTEEALRSVAEKFGLKAGKLIGAVRVATTGRAHAPGIFDVLVTLGQAAALGRLRRAIEQVDRR
jgi:glutamyl-tRNA synthetase